MNVNDIIKKLTVVTPYDKGTHQMWTDAYISEQLLQMHIDPETDRASRKSPDVNKTVAWIMNRLPKGTQSLLDLGCGPGLYTSAFAERGLHVKGVDFSPNSIRYARQTAKAQGLNISYECSNYLSLDDNEAFDVIVMIYCDFGVLSDTERGVMLQRIFKALKPGGIFVFDAFNNHILNELSFKKTWEVSNGGFWSAGPYMCLSESIHFPSIDGFLDQYIVIDSKDQYALYRFWNHYFSQVYLADLFEHHGFKTLKAFENVITDKSVTFYLAQKSD